MGQGTLAEMEIYRGEVLPEWIDINGHMNVAYYVLAFDLAVDTLWARFGLTDEYIRAQKSSTFAVEMHVVYRRELVEKAPFRICSQILAYDKKRIHQLQRMYHAESGELVATAEWMNLHVDMKTRRVAPWPPAIFERIAEIAAAQRGAVAEADIGRVMQLNSPLYSLAESG